MSKTRIQPGSDLAPQARHPQPQHLYLAAQCSRNAPNQSVLQWLPRWSRYHFTVTGFLER